MGEPQPVEDPLLRMGSPKLEFTLPLSMVNPTMNRKHVYEITIEAKQGDKTISQSRSIFLQPVDGVAPVAHTPAALSKALGPGVHILEVKEGNQRIMVTGTYERGARNPEYALTGLLGCLGMGGGGGLDPAAPGRWSFTYWGRAMPKSGPFTSVVTVRPPRR